MLGLSASKWASHPNSSNYTTSSEDAEAGSTSASPITPLFSPQGTTSKPSSAHAIQDTQSNPSILTPFIMSVAIQSPFGTTLPDTPVRQPLFVPPKKTVVRITAPPESSNLSSKDTQTQKPPPDQLIPSPTENKILASSADAFFSEEQHTQTFDSLKHDLKTEAFSSIQGSNDPLSKPISLPDLNTRRHLTKNELEMSNSKRAGDETVNPYLAYVAQIDPDGTMDDGRAYVGGARHYVDKSIIREQSSSSAPKSANLNSFGGSQIRSPDLSQSQVLPSASKPRGYGRDRGMPDSRWSGRPLATADMLPEDFFKTAKSTSTPATTAPNPPKPLPRYEGNSSSPDWSTTRNFNSGGRSSSPTGRSETGRSETGRSESGRSENRGYTQSSESRYAPQRNSVDGSRSEYHNEKQRMSPGYARQQHTQNHHHQNQEFDSARRNGQNDDNDHHAMRSRDNEYDSDLESSMSRANLNSSREPPRYANGNSASLNSSAPQTLLPQNPGNPLFLQYPIGDGCHVVVAMYVEKDAQTAVKRFPGIERTRQESSRRDKSLEEIAQIFKEALEDEKKTLLES